MIQICLLSFISDFGIRISNFFNEEGLLDLMSMSRARVRHIFSAKGAAFTSSLGAAPQDSWNPKPPALKARFTSPSSWIIIRSMSQSLSKVILHIIFSTKNREPWLDYDMQPRMHAYCRYCLFSAAITFLLAGLVIAVPSSQEASGP
ncbi:MAG: hypothetical protein DME20_04795 [Verrucomicrobia bacterium]|nr:MAG: hypothetical protein DME20_04795 [Verrucomicrobiota bacterium]